jgi:excisionase family DNA binding protein
MGRAPCKIGEYKQSRKHPHGPAKRLYSVPEAAYYLGRTVDGLREVMWSGRLPYIKDGRRVLLDIHDMDRYIEENKTRFTY